MRESERLAVFCTFAPPRRGKKMLHLVRREEQRKKMSGTVDYVKVVDLLVDTIKELNVPCADTEEPLAPTAMDAGAEHSAGAAGVVRVAVDTAPVRVPRAAQNNRNVPVTIQSTSAASLPQSVINDFRSNFGWPF